MNDLAEKALHGLRAAGRQLSARVVAVLALVGFVFAAAVVVLGGRIGAAPSAVPLNHWLGLLPDAGYRVTGIGLGAAVFAMIGLLIALWLLTLRISRRRRFTPRQVWTIAAAWALPFAVGPPLLSTDIYRYVADGVLMRRGHSPYHRGADSLGSLRLVDAIDPNFRSLHSTDGPLATQLSHLAVTLSGGSITGAVIVLRAIAVLSVIMIGRLAGDVAGSRRSAALCLTVLNPAVLLFVVSDSQYTGVLVALLLAALVTAAQRHWWRAIVLVCLAAGVKPVALVALPAVIAIHVFGWPAALRLRMVMRDCALAALTLGAVAVSAPFGLGWFDNLGAAMHTHTPFAPAAVLGKLVGFVVPSASFDDLAVGGRIACGVAAVIVVGYLYLTVRTRPLARTVGYALLAAGLLAPVSYPDYLLWGVLCLAPNAVGARRDWVIALSCVACVLVPGGLGTRGGQYATSIALAVIAAGLLPRLYARHRATELARATVSAGG